MLASDAISSDASLPQAVCGLSLHVDVGDMQHPGTCDRAPGDPVLPPTPP